jgi:hypothetical protein
VAGAIGEAELLEQLIGSPPRGGAGAATDLVDDEEVLPRGQERSKETIDVSSPA